MLDTPATDRPRASVWLRRRHAPDRVVCALAAIPLAPVAAALAAAIMATSPGRPIIRLPRVGADGHEFGLWKLRSMRSEPPATDAAPAITVADDDRITPLGRRLRRFRLDEIPQLGNVIAGQMGLIGPRPESPGFVDLDDERWQVVLQARPGIAGPTQLMVHEWESTLTDTTTYQREVLPVKLAIDTWYVTHASARIDLLVVCGLALSLVLGRSDTALQQLVRAEVPEAAAIPR